MKFSDRTVEDIRNQMGKNRLLGVENYKLIKLLAKVLTSKRSPGDEMNDFFKSRRPGKNQRQAIADLIFFVLNNKKRLFCSVMDRDNHKSFYDVIADVLSLAKRICFFPDKLFLDKHDLKISKALERFELFETSALPDFRKVSIRFNYPVWIVKYFFNRKGPSYTYKVLTNSNNRRGFICLRVNTIKVKPREVQRFLTNVRVESVVSEILPDCIYIRGKGNILGLESYEKGFFEIQDFGSQLITKVLNPKPYAIVVDYCCGAGGKTLSLSSIMKNTGLIYAIDVSSQRINQLKMRANRAGVTNLYPLVVSHSDNSKIEHLRRKASFVLVDVPCTGSGTFIQYPHLKWRITQKIVADYTRLQRNILEKAAECCKKGGILVYSTCSIFEDENNLVTDDFLKNNQDFSPVLWNIGVSVQNRKRLDTFLETDWRGGAILLDSSISKYGFYFQKFVRNV
tara:strand:+ start:1120 stop:2481 length:1362 start_codon:yes stop_codon:yes gene_type:complete